MRKKLCLILSLALILSCLAAGPAASAASHKHSWSAYKVTRKATFSKDGKMVRTCKTCKKKQTKTITRICDAGVCKNNLYTGKAIKAKPYAYTDNMKNISKSFYTVSYKNNVKPGTGQATITFKGRYTGKRTVKFRIFYSYIDQAPFFQNSRISKANQVLKIGHAPKAGESVTLISRIAYGDRIGTDTVMGAFGAMQGPALNQKNVTKFNAQQQKLWYMATDKKTLGRKSSLTGLMGPANPSLNINKQFRIKTAEVTPGLEGTQKEFAESIKTFLSNNDIGIPAAHFTVPASRKVTFSGSSETLKEGIVAKATYTIAYVQDNYVLIGVAGDSINEAVPVCYIKVKYQVVK